MIEQPALVAAVRHHTVWVRSCTASECGACDAGRGCGAGWLLRLFGVRRGRPLALHCTEALAVGDRIVLSIPERWLLLAAGIAYGGPLVGLLLGAVLGERAGQEPGAIAMGVTGFVLASLGARALGDRLAKTCPLGVSAPRGATGPT